MSSLCTKWNFSSFEDLAANIRMGTLTSPNEIVPDQIDRAIETVVPGAARSKTPAGPPMFTCAAARLQLRRGILWLLHLTGVGRSRPAKAGLARCEDGVVPVDNPVDRVDNADGCVSRSAPERRRRAARA